MKETKNSQQKKKKKANDGGHRKMSQWPRVNAWKSCFVKLADIRVSDWKAANSGGVRGGGVSKWVVGKKIQPIRVQEKVWGDTGAFRSREWVNPGEKLPVLFNKQVTTGLITGGYLYHTAALMTRNTCLNNRWNCLMQISQMRSDGVAARCWSVKKCEPP